MLKMLPKLLWVITTAFLHCCGPEAFAAQPTLSTAAPPRTTTTAPHPGNCPDKAVISGFCVSQCNTDSQCSSSQKCCPNGCANICTQAVGITLTTATTTARPVSATTPSATLAPTTTTTRAPSTSVSPPTQPPTAVLPTPNCMDLNCRLYGYECVLVAAPCVGATCPPPVAQCVLLLPLPTTPPPPATTRPPATAPPSTTTPPTPTTTRATSTTTTSRPSSSSLSPINVPYIRNPYYKNFARYLI